MELADAVAQCALRKFDSLPAKCRPRERANGQREWVPFSAIVLVQDANVLDCVSIATGMKCLPRDKIPQAKGMVLHDCHAEILAIRTFNRFLLDQCQSLLDGKSGSRFVRCRSKSEQDARKPQPFALLDGICIYMYCSEAPCGDASMELIIDAQEDQTSWDIPTDITDTQDDSHEQFKMPGRGYFSMLGRVRRKPARSDAPLTLSKSCSDKLTRMQCTSLLGSIASLVISPDNVYIHTLVLPESQYVPIAIDRAFSATGRLEPYTQAISASTTLFSLPLRPFNVATTANEFPWSRRAVAAGDTLVPSNIATIATPGFQEVLINGVLQGRKQFDPKGASRVCRRSIWQKTYEIAQASGNDTVAELLGVQSYAEIKKSSLLEVRSTTKATLAKTALNGWVKNDGDSDFALES